MNTTEMVQFYKRLWSAYLVQSLGARHYRYYKEMHHLKDNPCNSGTYNFLWELMERAHQTPFIKKLFIRSYVHLFIFSFNIFDQNNMRKALNRSRISDSDCPQGTSWLVFGGSSRTSTAKREILLPFYYHWICGSLKH